MLIEKLKPNFEFRDERGELVQLVREGFKQVNVITSHVNMVRGGHYHKQNTEVFYIIFGKCKVVVENSKGECEEQIFSSGDMFKIEAFVMHSFEYMEETLLISMYDNGVELEDRMDIYTTFDYEEQSL